MSNETEPQYDHMYVARIESADHFSDHLIELLGDSKNATHWMNERYDGALDIIELGQPGQEEYGDYCRIYPPDADYRALEEAAQERNKFENIEIGGDGVVYYEDSRRGIEIDVHSDRLVIYSGPSTARAAPHAAPFARGYPLEEEGQREYMEQDLNKPEIKLIDEMLRRIPA